MTEKICTYVVGVAAEKSRLAVRWTGGPGEVDRDGVVVTEDITVRLLELGGLVVPVRGLQGELLGAAVEDLVHGLASVDQRRIVAKGLDGVRDTVAVEL